MSSSKTIYTADIGSWERGKNIDLPGATNINDALKIAKSFMDITKFNPPQEFPYVVKIYKDKKIVWDWMNGSLNE